MDCGIIWSRTVNIMECRSYRTLPPRNTSKLHIRRTKFLRRKSKITILPPSCTFISLIWSLSNPSDLLTKQCWYKRLCQSWCPRNGGSQWCQWDSGWPWEPPKCRFECCRVEEKWWQWRKLHLNQDFSKVLTQ